MTGISGQGRGRWAVVLLTATMALGAVGCKGSGEAGRGESVQASYDRAKSLYDRKKYDQAVLEFTRLSYQARGTELEDDAHYYLGLSQFGAEEFRGAAGEFTYLADRLSSSPYYGDALYMRGIAYYRLAPRASLDQTNTEQAIDQFQLFIEAVPTHDKVPDAEAKITELRNRLGQKAASAADLYFRLEDYRAATVAYDRVLSDYFDTDYADDAGLGKVRSLALRRRYDEARTAIAEFRARFPQSTLMTDVEAVERSLPAAATVQIGR